MREKFCLDLEKINDNWLSRWRYLGQADLAGDALVGRIEGLETLKTYYK